MSWQTYIVLQSWQRFPNRRTAHCGSLIGEGHTGTPHRSLAAFNTEVARLIIRVSPKNPTYTRYVNDVLRSEIQWDARKPHEVDQRWVWAGSTNKTVFTSKRASESRGMAGSRLRLFSAWSPSQRFAFACSAPETFFALFAGCTLHFSSLEV